MTEINLFWKMRFNSRLYLPLLLIPVFSFTAFAQNTPPPNPCPTDAIYRQFDFWVGEWDVYNPDEQKVGSNIIEKAENGCLLIENWTSVQGGTGKSMNYYDPSEKAWKQVWVSGNANIGYFSGGLKDKAMFLDGHWVNPDGSTYRLRGTWTPLEDGRVRQHFEASQDDGETWSTWFDGYYVRK